MHDVLIQYILNKHVLRQEFSSGKKYIYNVEAKLFYETLGDALL